MRYFEEYEVNSVKPLQPHTFDCEVKNCAEMATKTVEIAHIQDKWSRLYDVCDAHEKAAWDLFMAELERKGDE